MLKETEEKMSAKFGKPMAIRQSNPKYNADYVDNIVRTKYLPRLEKQIEEEKSQMKFSEVIN